MPQEPEPTDIRLRAGLCGTCVHAIVRPTRRGTVYLRCGLASADDRYPKYPRLPVLNCPGYAAKLS
jgi:hypothetical protein